MKILISVWLLVLLGWSCQMEPDTDLDPPPPGPPPPVVNDTTLLYKLVFLDTTETAPRDTVAYNQFSYDSQKRVVDYYEVYFYTTRNVYDTSTHTRYFYTGNDTLPNKSARITDEGGVNEATWDTSYLSYDNTGRLIRDSSVVSVKDNANTVQRNVIVKSYTYTSYGVYQLVKEHAERPGIYIFNRTRTQKIYNTVVNGKITAQTDSIEFTGSQTYNGVTTPLAGSLVCKAQLSYDNAINPLYKALPVHYPAYINPFGMNLFYTAAYDFFTTPNNLISETSTFEGVSDGATISEPWHLDNAYQYNNANRPVISRESIDPTDVVKNVYLYKK